MIVEMPLAGRLHLYGLSGEASAASSCGMKFGMEALSRSPAALSGIPIVRAPFSANAPPLKIAASLRAYRRMRLPAFDGLFRSAGAGAGKKEGYENPESSQIACAGVF